MANFVIEVDLDAVKVGEKKKQVISAADEMKVAYKRFFDSVEAGNKNISHTNAAINTLKPPTQNNISGSNNAALLKISHYRDLDAAERALTTTVDREAKAQKLARQIASKEAYEQQVQMSRKTTNVITANVEKQLKAEGAAWNILEKDLKHYQQSSLHANAVITQSEKSLAETKIQLSKHTNVEEITAIKKRLAAEKQAENEKKQLSKNGIFGQVAAGSFVGNLGASAATKIISELQSIPTYALQAGKALFDLTKEASDYGRELGTANTRTGLTVESLSSLRYAAQLSHVEFSELSQPLNFFTTRLGAAAKGSEETRTKLRALGVTNFNDLEGSLSQVFKRIESLPPGVQRMNAATDAFGEDAANKLIPIINKMGGNLAEFQKKAASLGITLSGESVQSAKEFGLAYDTVSSQVTGLTNQFALEFAPAVSDSLNDFSKYLADNKGAVKEWGSYVGDIIRGVSQETKELQDPDSTKGMAAKGLLAYLKNVGGFRSMANLFAEKGEGVRKTEEARWKNVVRVGADGIEGKDFVSLKNRGQYTDEFKQAESLKTLQRNQKDQLAVLSSNYRIKEAELNSHLTYTAKQELEQFQTVSQARSKNIQDEIALQKSSFAQQIGAVAGNRDKTEELTAQRNEILSRLNGDLRVNSINELKQTQQLERQIYEQRRNDSIEFFQNQIKESQFGYDNQLFDVQRALSAQRVSVSAGYSQIEDITRQSYQTMLVLLKDSHVLELKNLSLTNEQRENLTKKQNLEEKNLAEQNRRQIIDIENQKTTQLIEIAQRRSRSIMDALSLISSTGSAFSDFFSPENFSSSAFGNVQKSIQSAIDRDKEQLKVFESMRDAARSKMDKTDAGTFAKDWAKEDFDRLNNSVIDLKRKMPELNSEFVRFGNTLQKNFDFDKVGLDLLQDRQAKEERGLIEQIKLNESLYTIEIGKEKFNRDEVKIAQLTAENNLLLGQKNIQQTLQEIELERYKRNTRQGLTGTLEKLRNGEAGEFAGFRDAAQKGVLREHIGYYQEFISLEEQLAFVGEDSAIRYKNAWMSAILEIKEADIQAVESQIQSQVRLADASSVHVEQVKAKVLEHLASQKTKTEAVADGIISIYDKAANFIEKRLGKIAEIPIIGDLAKFSVRSALSDITTGIMDKFLPGMGDKLERSKNPQLAEAKDQTKILTEIRDALTGGSSFGSSSGSSSSGGLGLGKILGAALGGGSSSGGNLGNRASNNNPYIFNASGSSNNKSTNLLQAALSLFQRDSMESPVPVTLNSGSGGIIDKITHRDGSTYSAGGFSLNKSIFGEKGFGNNVGTYSAIGTGVSLLGSLFGNGKLGSTISGAGQGLAMGASIGTFLLPGIGTALGAGLGAGIGALVGFISGLFGSNKQKKEDQKIASAIQGDAFKQIDELIRQVKIDKQDGQSAIASANGIRSQYLEQANALKDKKTRNQAVQAVSGIDSRISTLTQAAADQDRRREVADKWRGYNTGGLIRGFGDGGTAHPMFEHQMGYNKFNAALPHNFSGHIPGSFDKKDDVLLAVSRGERVIVMTPEQWEVAGHHITPHLQQANVPGFNTGGGHNTPTVNNSFSSESNNGQSDEPIVVEVKAPPGFELRMLSKAAKTRDGRKIIFRAVQEELSDS